jgi:hypothetical protein
MIIILGDSWGVGEWGLDKNEFCLVGPGIGQYISLHDTVINLSLGSGSNTQSLNRFELLLEKYQLDKSDTVYWIVTDPLRCADDTDLKFSETIESKVKFFLDQCLSRANLIGKKHQIVINLIGGLCDVDDIDISNYKWLNISVPSWGMLIDKNYNSSLYCLSTKWKLIGDLADSSIKKSEWFNLTKLCKAKRKSMKNIFPTDHHHPDRYGHIILRNYLYPEWQHKF